MASLQMVVRIEGTADVLAYATLAFGLSEIKRRGEEDVYGFSSRDAGEIAGRALEAAHELEKASDGA